MLIVLPFYGIITYKNSICNNFYKNIFLLWFYDFEADFLSRINIAKKVDTNKIM